MTLAHGNLVPSLRSTIGSMIDMPVADFVEPGSEMGTTDEGEAPVCI